MNNNTKQSASYELTLQSNNATREKGQDGDAFKGFLFNEASAEKKALETFIADTFSQHYDAHLLNFYPHLLGAYDNNQQPYAAIGYRRADEQRLFLEQYLEQPLESLLERYSEEQAQTSPLSRKHIVEIGNLAATKRGACRSLFQLLTQYFHQSDCRWIVFTGTRTVRVVLRRMRLKAYEITAADSHVLNPSAQKSWGRYYDQEPMVMAMPTNQILPASLASQSMTSTVVTG